MKKELDWTHLKTYSLQRRKSKVRLRDLARPIKGKKSFSGFLQGLPHILAARDFRSVVEAVWEARARGKPILFMMGAHVLKVGLSPVLIDMMRRRLITALAFNGAGMIHDFELAFMGATSEEVADLLPEGKFGMARETSEFILKAINQGVGEGLGLGCALGKAITESRLAYKRLSVFACAYAMKLPVTVHVGMGTDIIHQHPLCDGAKIGEGSMRDFYTLVEVVKALDKGGVVFNCGSAVILPEVFLKALNLARNLEGRVKDFTSVSLDMIYHYRPQMNVVRRPVVGGGRGYYLIGHHELMLPLLYHCLVERGK